MHIAWMTVKEIELMESFRNLNLGVSVSLGSIRLGQIRIKSSFNDQVEQAQWSESEFQKTLALVQEGKLTGFVQGGDGLWKYQGRICVPASGDLRKNILEEAHKSNFTMHPRSNKIYQDLKKMFWWPGMKKDIAKLVSKCLLC